MFKSIKMLLRALAAIALAIVLTGCTSSVEKGMALMQRVMEETPNIAQIQFASLSEPFHGISIVESDIMMRDSALNHLFIAEIDLDANLTLRPSSPGDRPFSKEMGQQNMVEQAKAAEENGHKVYLGINADVFGYYEGLDFFSPRGVHYADGKDLSTSRGDENVIYVLKDGSVHLDKYEDFLKVESEVENAVGAWHSLVWDGQVHTADEYPEKNLLVVNPRTFFGISEDGRKVWFFVADGRQEGYSLGLKMEDMVGICKAMGCKRACNLDGGGSTTMVIRVEDENGVDFALYNRPSDIIAGQRTPRRVANGLLVVEK